eukprot:3690847-Prymnesium_polylepis.1
MSQEESGQMDHNDVLVCVLMLINAIIGSPEELRERLQLRNEFIELGLLEVIAPLRDSPELEEVIRQLTTFDNEWSADLKELSSVDPSLAAALKSPDGSSSRLLAVAVSPLLLLHEQQQINNAVSDAVLPVLTDVLRSLAYLPDNDVGVESWKRVSKAIEAIAKEVAGGARSSTQEA